MPNYVAICLNPDTCEARAAHPVNIYYWWPGKKIDKDMDCPDEFRSLARRASRSKSNYAVCATVDLPTGRVCTTSRCMNIDLGVKRYGRDKALGRLRGDLLKLGYDMIQIPG